ncbi:MAG: DsrE family protein [Lacisediminihabitans sp.]
MPKNVIYIFHDDDASLNAGSRMAEGIASAASDDVELEVFCFGPAQAALTDDRGNAVRSEYRERIIALAGSGVTVSTCDRAAVSAGVDGDLRDNGIALVSPRDTMIRFAREGATVINF